MAKMYILVIGLFSIFGPALWCFVVYIISVSSGWQSLAKSYSTAHFPEKSTLCSGILNSSANYSFTLRFAESHEGIYLKTTKLFSIGHKPLFIPFSKVQHYQRSKGIFTKYTHTFKVDGTNIKLYLNEEISFLSNVKKIRYKEI